MICEALRLLVGTLCYAMKFEVQMPVLPGSPPVDVELRRSARARRFSLRVSRLDGRVTLSLPHGAREAEAMAFLRAQEGWVRAALAKMPGVAVVGVGTALPFEGRMLTVVSGGGRSVRIVDDSLIVPGDPASAAVKARAYFKLLARDRLSAACDLHAGRLGRRFSRLSLRDTRSRWGSCTSDGGLMFSWRLIMAPPAVLDYVAAHEVAHLAQMNHSPAFWAVVAGLCPGYGAHRTWLRGQGQTLHGYRFGD
jgi:predicted metal-dependent hydrolase